MSKIKIGAQVTAKVFPTKVTVSGTFQGYELQDKEDPKSVCGKVFYVKDGMQRLDFVYVDSIKCDSESEDERIRKYIVKFVELEKGVNLPPDDADKMLAYLEKQKEQKPVHTAKEMWEEMRLEVYAQASGNRHEPNYSDDSTKMFSLCDIDEIFDKIGNSTVRLQPAEWSEEDELKLRLCIDALDVGQTRRHIYEQGITPGELIAWLKSLRHQPKQEWSEEEEKDIQKASEYLRDYANNYVQGGNSKLYVQSLADRIESLRPQTQWKPSKEQMVWLESAVKLSTDKPYIHGTIISLYEQLKRL